MIARSNLFALLAGIVFTLAGCTVEPLYSSYENGVAEKPSVFVEVVDGRYEQQVRDRLIFLLHGGAGQPRTPAVNANLTVSSAGKSILSVQRDGTDSDTTASRLTLTGVINLKDASTGELLKSYKREAFASYDRSTQEFANDRALIDAENRAAKELAAELAALVTAYMRSR